MAIKRFTKDSAKQAIAHYALKMAESADIYNRKISDCANCKGLHYRFIDTTGSTSNIMFRESYLCAAGFGDPVRSTNQNCFPLVVGCTKFAPVAGDDKIEIVKEFSPEK